MKEPKDKRTKAWKEWDQWKQNFDKKTALVWVMLLKR